MKEAVRLHLEINHTELLAAARRAAAVAPQASPLEILRGVLLATDGGGALTLSATSLEITVEQTIPCPIQEPDSIVVSAKLLVAMLEKLRGGTVTLCHDLGSSVLHLSSGDAAYAVPAEKGDVFPHSEIPLPENLVPVSGIPDLLRRTMFAISGKCRQPLLKCVDLMFTAKGLHAAGSDGACIVSAVGDSKCTGGVELLVPAASLEKLARMSDDRWNTKSELLESTLSSRVKTSSSVRG